MNRGWAYEYADAGGSLPCAAAAATHMCCDIIGKYIKGRCVRAGERSLPLARSGCHFNPLIQRALSPGAQPTASHPRTATQATVPLAVEGAVPAPPAQPAALHGSRREQVPPIRRCPSGLYNSAWCCIRADSAVRRLTAIWTILPRSPDLYPSSRPAGSVPAEP